MKLVASRAIFSLEKSVEFQRTTRCYIPEDTATAVRMSNPITDFAFSYTNIKYKWNFHGAVKYYINHVTQPIYEHLYFGWCPAVIEHRILRLSGQHSCFIFRSLNFKLRPIYRTFCVNFPRFSSVPEYISHSLHSMSLPTHYSQVITLYFSILLYIVY
jgi:hypothetical protein